MASPLLRDENAPCQHLSAAGCNRLAGWFSNTSSGLTPHPISAARLAGAMLLIAGVVLIRD
jgi:hypothetical protein